MTLDISHKRLIQPVDAELEQKWRELEAKALPSIFLSWAWISNWLLMIKEPVYLVEARVNENIVGLGFFVERTRKVFGCIPMKQWFLHRTGIPETDQIWMEHNDFLLDPQNKNELRLALVNYLVTSRGLAHIQEFIIGLSGNDEHAAFKQHFPFHYESVSTHGFSVDLSALSNDYLTEAVSKNTRSQIKRSLKLLAETGKLSFRVVSSPQECQKLMPIIGQVHIERWQHTDEGSGFSNVKFCDFHQGLIDNEGRVVEIAVLTHQEKDIGFLINYISGNHISFYLSALTLSENSKIKIGLVLHCKAIQHYLERGYKVYDFLGGYSQYKQSLATEKYPLTLNVYPRKSSLLWFEQVIKACKQRLTE